MNRYMAEGVADDLVQGRTVIVVSSSPRDSMGEVLYRLQSSPVTVVRAYGREEIKHPSGGRARFISTRSRGAGRGMTADVLVLAGPVSTEQREDLLPCAMRGEVIE
jgi:hypothetical protein